MLHGREIESDGLSLIAYSLPGAESEAHPIVPAAPGRAWMRETHKQFAHRCLPLLMANQSGWFLLNRRTFTVTWNGSRSIHALRVEYEGEAPELPLVLSLFGCGILTWTVDYLFRTPPGYNLLARGPANMPKDGIAPLEGLVETDWAVATFTMNWKFTRPDHPVTFEEGEPFCMLVPQKRRELERFEPVHRRMRDEPELKKQWQAFHNQRLLMSGVRELAFRRGGYDSSDKVPFERHYFEGTSPGGWSATDHQVKRELRPFARPADPVPAPSEPAESEG
jgi:hypothetical protein